MKRKLMTGFLMAASMMLAAATTDTDITKKVRHEVLMYPNYTIWDNVEFRVNNGQVELMGAVSQPFKKTDIERLVQRVPGVTSVTDEIKVLPLSSFDDRLRLQVARAVYGDPSLNRYAMGANASIHILVDNGHVTLVGSVATEMDKQIAGMRASGAGLSLGAVTNDLQVEHPSRKG